MGNCVLTTRLRSATLLAASFVVWSAGCAKIAPPEPPHISIPMPATDLAARQVADSVVLTVSRPVQDTSGSPASLPKRLDVFRLDEEATAGNGRPLSDEEFLKQSVLIQSIPSSRFSGYLHGSTFVIQDTLPPEPTTAAPTSSAAPTSPAAQTPKAELPIGTTTYRYAVLFVNKHDRAAGFSNQVIIRPIAIPPAPQGLVAAVTEHSIRLTWRPPLQNTDGSTPPRIAGYAVYRSEEAASFPSSPINEQPLQQPEYEDRNFVFDRTYYYAVRTLGSMRDPNAESLPSEALAVTPRDVFPPAPPKDFKSLTEGSTVILLWAPSISTDVAGYRLFRQEKGTTVRQPLQKELITTWSCRDTQAASGKSYEYSIQAVDAHGNESEAIRTDVEIK